MAQPNVAREPSMEEILASIRRIIESNDPVTESDIVRGAQASSYEDAGDEFEIESDYDDESYLPQAAANDPGRARSEELEAERVNMTMESRNPAPMPAQPSDKTLSLADVAARVRAAASRVPEPVAQRPVSAQPAQQAAHGHAEPRFERPVAEPSRTMPASEPVHSEPVSERAAPVVETREAPIAPRQEAQTTAADSLPARIEQAGLLISDEAGAQIARSFNELADVVSGIEKQSVEDMAKEMLKPMLREWLDDNLPTLVERLVREEIERVARGPRR